jgi:hypothetical protein
MTLDAVVVIIVIMILTMTMMMMTIMMTMMMTTMIMMKKIVMMMMTMMMTYSSRYIVPSSSSPYTSSSSPYTLSSFYASGPFSSDDGDDSYDETDKTIRGYSESHPPTLICPYVVICSLHACMYSIIMCSLATVDACIIYSIM